MNEDILKMLGLDQKPTEPKIKITAEKEEDFDWRREQEHYDEDMHSEPEYPSSTALRLDEWDLNKGAELHKKLKPEKIDADTLADFHGAVFKEEPTLQENCIDKRKLEYLRNMMETPEFRILHKDTKLNLITSRIAATKIMQQYTKLKEQDEKRERNKPKTEKQAKKQAQQAEGQCVLAAGEAVEEAQEEIDELNTTLSALGAGKEAGSQGKLNPEEIGSLFKKVRSNDLLRQIIAEAGRMKSYARGKQKEKTQFGYDDLIGITLSGDPSRILASELMLLDEPELELDSLIRLAEGRMLSKEYIGIETVGLGPIVAIQDGSSSMYPKHLIQAKAFCLTMAWIAQWQRRPIVLVEFGSSDEGNYLVMKPDKWNQESLLDWLVHFYGGGTEYHTPFEKVPFEWWLEFKLPKGKTDCFFITDGIIQIPDDIVVRYNQWKKEEKVITRGLSIGHYSTSEMEKVCDKVYSMSSLVLGERAIQEAFSV